MDKHGYLEEADLAALQAGDKVGVTFARGGWGNETVVRSTTVTKLTPAQAVTEKYGRFHRVGRRAGQSVGGAEYRRCRLVSLTGTAAIQSRLYDERERLADVMKELTREKITEVGQMLRHLDRLAELVESVRARVKVLNQTPTDNATSTMEEQ